jgi:hypothetical protein
VVLPAAQATRFGDSDNGIPFASTPIQYQQVFDGTDIGSPFLAIGLSLRQDEAYAGHRGQTVDLEIALGHTTYSAATLTSTFASHFTAGRTTRQPRRQVALPDMSPTRPTDPRVVIVDLPFTRVFPISPGQNLLIEVINRGNGNGNFGFPFPLDAATNPRTTQLVGNGATGNLGVGYGLVMCFRGSGGAGAVPLLSHSGVPSIKGSFQVHLEFAAPSSVSLLFFGRSDRDWNGVPLPFDLGPLGAPGCRLLASGQVIDLVATDGNGSGSHTYHVPDDRTVLGAVSYNHHVVLDRQANPLGLVTTRGGRGQIGN